MSRVSEALAKARARKQNYMEVYEQAIKESVREVLEDSDLIKLNMMASQPSSIRHVEQVDKLTKDIAANVIRNISDYVRNFRRILDTRGIPNRSRVIGITTYYRAWFVTMGPTGDEVGHDGRPIYDITLDEQEERVAERLEIQPERWAECPLFDLHE